MLRYISLLWCLIPALLAGCGKSVAKDPLAGVGGYKLVYQQREQRRIEPEKIAASLRERINAKSESEVVVNVLDDGGCEILLPGVDKNAVADIKRAIARSNLLKFRIVAEDYFDKKLKAATAEGKDAPGAFWASYEPDKVKDLRDAIVRTEADGKSRVLILDGPEPVDAWHVEYSEISRDEFQGPCLDVTLNGEGSRRMAILTSAYRLRRLAIIVDGVLISSPIIQSQFSSKGRITGQFSEDELQFLVAVLKNSHALGSLETEPTAETMVPAVSKE